jgi:hypothetical protein
MNGLLSYDRCKDGKLPSIPVEKVGTMYYFCSPFTADIAQVVRAPVCGTGGRRFESGYSPKILKMGFQSLVKAAFAAAFLFASCGQSSTDQHPGAINLDTIALKPGQSVFFENLTDGDTLSNPILIKFGLKEMQVMPTDSGVRANAGHHHLLIDTLPFIAAGEMVPMNSDKFKHFGKGQTYTHIELPAGSHQIALQFADGFHRSYGFRMSKVVKVIVR